MRKEDDEGGDIEETGGGKSGRSPSPVFRGRLPRCDNSVSKYTYRFVAIGPMRKEKELKKSTNVGKNFHFSC